MRQLFRILPWVSNMGVSSRGQYLMQQLFRILPWVPNKGLSPKGQYLMQQLLRILPWVLQSMSIWPPLSDFAKIPHLWPYMELPHPYKVREHEIRNRRLIASVSVFPLWACWPMEFQWANEMPSNTITANSMLSSSSFNCYKSPSTSSDEFGSW